MPIYIYICATHFLKSAIRKVDYTLQINVKVSDKIKIKIRKTFILSFTLLQNASNLEEFEKHFIDILIIFNSEKQNTTFLTSISKLRKAIIERDLSPIIDENRILEKNIFQFASNDTKKKIKENSKFGAYFKNLCDKLTSLIKIKKNNSNEPDNEYFSPALFKIITNQLYILPLWTGLIVFTNIPVNLNVKHLTGNPVESYFNHLKNTLLQVNKKQNMIRRLMPSEYASKLYKRLLSKYLEFYSDTNEKIIYEKNLSFETEKWKNGNQSNSRFRERGVHYKSSSNFGILDRANEKRLSKIPKNDFEIIFLAGIKIK